MRKAVLTKRVLLSIAPSTLEAAREAAKDEGATLSEYVRAAVRDRLRRDRDEPDIGIK